MTNKWWNKIKPFNIVTLDLSTITNKHLRDNIRHIHGHTGPRAIEIISNSFFNFHVRKMNNRSYIMSMLYMCQHGKYIRFIHGKDDILDGYRPWSKHSIEKERLFYYIIWLLTEICPVPNDVVRWEIIPYYVFA